MHTPPFPAVGRQFARESGPRLGADARSLAAAIPIELKQWAPDS
jgi:hypothetical protein